jgi:UDPglucose 6-dehydrogenase
VPEVDVVVVDVNVSRIKAWNSDLLPVSEPGLLDLVQRCRVSTYEDDTEPFRRRNLRFSEDVATGILESEIIFLCVDTAQSCDENGLDNPPDLANLKRAVMKVGETAVKDFIIVEKSTVPCGTARLLQSILSKTLRPGISYQILSNPEFLAEGTAIRDLKEPDRILIGSSETLHGRHATRLLRRLYEHWVPKDKIFTMDTWSSELSKLCANALLAQRISSVNSFSMVCEKVGADVRKIAKAVKADHRIGSHMLNASVGFGGSCFQKDIAHLAYLAKTVGLDHVAQYWMSVLAINQTQKDSFAKRISQRLACLPPMMTKIGVLGFAFKAETNDARHSPAIDIVKHLIGKHYDVQIYDPCVSESDILSALGIETSSKQELEHGLQVASSPYHACESASAVVVLTEWKEFELNPGAPANDISVGQEEDSKNVNGHDSDKSSSFSDSGLGSSCSQSMRLTSPLDWEQIAHLMTEPRYLFDGRNIVDDAVAKYGFKIERIGRNLAPMMVTGSID